MACWPCETLAAIPPGASSKGFNLGHSLLGNKMFEVIHFDFEFAGLGTYNVLLNPCCPVVQPVVCDMVQQNDYFILAIGSDQCATAFRAGGDVHNLSGLKDNFQRIQASRTTEAQYERALAQFQKQPIPPGQLLTWVCRDKVSYLDLSADRLELNPAAF